MSPSPYLTMQQQPSHASFLRGIKSCLQCLPRVHASYQNNLLTWVGRLGVIPIYLEPASACFWISASAPRCCVLPVLCCFSYSAWAALLPVRPATAPPTVPVTRSAIPEPRSDNCPRASCSWPSRFCWRPCCLRSYCVTLAKGHPYRTVVESRKDVDQQQ